MAVREILAGKAVVELGLRNRIQAGLKSAQNQFKAFGQSLSVVGGALLAGGTGILGSLAWPVKLAADMEQTTAAFKTLLGSGDAATKMVSDLENMAKTTPFETQHLTDGAQTLLNFGVSASNVLPMLQKLGDASLGNAEKFSRLTLAFGQAASKGRLMGQEVLQMTEAGFNPLQEISRTTGIHVKTLSDMMEKGQISIGMLENAFKTATSAGGRFAGAMNEQSKTTMGRWSALMDTVKISVRSIGDALLPAIKIVLTAVTQLVGPLGEWLKANRRLIQLFAALGIGLAAVGGLILGLAGVSFVASSGLGVLSAALTGLALLWAALTSPIGIVVVAITAAVAAAWHFRDAVMGALQPMMPIFNAIGDAVRNFGSIFMTTFQGVGAALLSGDLGKAAGIAMLGLQAAFWTGLADLGTVSAHILDLLSAWIPGFDNVRQYAAATFGAIANAITAGRWDLAGSIMLAKLQLVFAQTTSSLSFLWTSFSIGFMQVLDNLLAGMRTAWRTAVFSIADMILRIIPGALTGIREQLKQMQAEAQRADDAGFAQRDQQRFAAGQKSIESHRAAEDAAKARIAALESEASKAAEAAPTIEDRATEAARQLALAIAEAKRPDPRKVNKEVAAAASGGVAAVGKLASVGTFSAQAATLLGFSGSALEETARNTARTARGIDKLAKKKSDQPAFT